MSDTRISRRGAFASLVGGSATLWLSPRATAAKPVQSAQSAAASMADRITLYTYDEKGRLLSVVTHTWRRSHHHRLLMMGMQA